MKPPKGALLGPLPSPQAPRHPLFKLNSRRGGIFYNIVEKRILQRKGEEKLLDKGLLFRIGGHWGGLGNFRLDWNRDSQSLGEWFEGVEV